MPNTNRSGFSIIELMVSLLVLALISVAATSALSVGKRIWGNIQMSPSVPLLDAELNVLRGVISRKVGIGTTQGGGVSGTSKRLEFQGLGFEENGIHALGMFQIVAENEGLTLQHSTEGKKLALNLLTVSEISYYGEKHGDKVNDWYKDWLPSDPSPKLIRFNFAETEQNESYQLDFVFRQ